MNQLQTAFAFGTGFGAILVSVLAYAVFRILTANPTAITTIKSRVSPTLVALMATGLAFLTATAAHAQTAAPSITIPVDVIFTSANTWITTFAPIAAIGIGISIALAVLGYLGTMIVRAFHS